MRKKEILLVKEHRSPTNTQRQRIFDAYRGRGHRNNNLFLVYSIKTDQDWVLPSDRHLVHWIYFLETDPNVKFFELAAESHDERTPTWAVDVLLACGDRVTHKLGHPSARRNVSKFEQINDDSDVQDSHIRCRVFSDENLEPVVKTSLRWLKPIAFAAALRHQEYSRQTLVLLEYFNRHLNGHIGQIFTEGEICEYEPAVIFGLVVRLAIRGYIQLDLTSYGFGRGTPWALSIQER